LIARSLDVFTSLRSQLRSAAAPFLVWFDDKHGRISRAGDAKLRATLQAVGNAMVKRLIGWERFGVHSERGSRSPVAAACTVAWSGRCPQIEVSVDHVVGNADLPILCLLEDSPFGQ